MDKIKKIKKVMSKKGVKFLLISSPENIRYFLGRPIGCFFVIGEKDFIITSPLEKARAEQTGYETICTKKFFKELKKKCKGKIAYENLLLAQYKKLKRYFKRTTEFSELISDLRSIKTKDEIRKIKRAIGIAQIGMRAAKENLKPGITELELAREIEYVMRKKAEWFSFRTIVASGPNSRFPHYQTGKRKIKAKDPVIVDIGAIWNGYCSDMTRTFCLKPNKKFNEIYDKVLKAQQVYKKIRPRVKAKDIHKEAEKILGCKLIHGLGHGIGINVHEKPAINERSKDIFKVGNVLTIEPGIYNKFGVRIEDMFLLSRKGIIKLTKFPKTIG